MLHFSLKRKDTETRHKGKYLAADTCPQEEKGKIWA